MVVRYECTPVLQEAEECKDVASLIDNGRASQNPPAHVHM